MLTKECTASRLSLSISPCLKHRLISCERFGADTATARTPATNAPTSTALTATRSPVGAATPRSSSTVATSTAVSAPAMLTAPAAATAQRAQRHVRSATSHTGGRAGLKPATQSTETAARKRSTIDARRARLPARMMPARKWTATCQTSPPVVRGTGADACPYRCVSLTYVAGSFPAAHDCVRRRRQLHLPRNLLLRFGLASYGAEQGCGLWCGPARYRRL